MNFRARKEESVRFRLLNHVLQLDGQSRRIYEMRALFLPRLLRWDDRNFMAFSVESRYPFLDHESIELCLSFCPEILYQRGWTKFPLRLGLSGQLPRTVRDRRSKFGFETPRDRSVMRAAQSDARAWLASNRPLWDHVERKSVQHVAHRTWSGAEKGDELGQGCFNVRLRSVAERLWSQSLVRPCCAPGHAVTPRTGSSSWDHFTGERC